MFNIPPLSSHLLPIPFGSFLLPSYYPTSMSLFMQLFGRCPGLQHVHVCNGHSISRRQYFTVLFYILFFLHIFCPIFQNGSWALGGKISMSHLGLKTQQSSILIASPSYESLNLLSPTEKRSFSGQGWKQGYPHVHNGYNSRDYLVSLLLSVYVTWCLQYLLWCLPSVDGSQKADVGGGPNSRCFSRAPYRSVFSRT